MKIECTTDELLSHKYLCFVARSIQLGLYQLDDYLVLPDNRHRIIKSVIFPRMQYPDRFWASLTHLANYSLGESYPVDLLNQTAKLLGEGSLVIASQTAELWKEQLDRLTHSIKTVFNPHVLSSIRTIIVLGTTIGSPGSFSKIRLDRREYDLICTIRTDLPFTDMYSILVKGIISITQQGYTDLGTLGYHQREAVFTFLRDNTHLQSLLGSPSQQSISPALRKESDQYLEELGFPPHGLLQKDRFLPLLTPKEKALFTSLEANKGIVVSFDAVANAVWKEKIDEKFSLYALSKLIESVRHKLHKIGIHHQMIFTLRGQGYMFLP